MRRPSCGGSRGRWPPTAWRSSISRTGWKRCSRSPTGSRVIRDGRHISTRPVAEVTPEAMIAEMVGREVGNYFAKMPSTARDEVLLSVADLGVAGVFQGISFDLHRGEVLCMAGLIGARRTDVALALFGMLQGAVGPGDAARARPLQLGSPRDAIAAGIAYVSEDRRKLGLAMALPIRWNISLATLRRYLSRLGADRPGGRSGDGRGVPRAAEHPHARCRDRPVGTLSGGNQQKVMLAKWLNLEPDLLIVDEPTRGIDVGRQGRGARPDPRLRRRRRRGAGDLVGPARGAGDGRPHPGDARRAADGDPRPCRGQSGADHARWPPGSEGAA